MITQKEYIFKKASSLRMFKYIAVFLFVILTQEMALAQSGTNAADNKNADQKLINQFVQSKGTGIIAFDASNIKQFWIDNSVFSRNGDIEILLKSGHSIPLKLQLANVSGTQDCMVEVVSEMPDISFTVSDMKSKTLSTSSFGDKFLNYNVASSSFSMEKTLIDHSPSTDFCFQLTFHSPNSDTLKIKAIALSFSKEKNVISTPSGNIQFSFDDINVRNSTIVKGDVDTSFSVTGRNSIISSKKSILVSDKQFSYSIAIKNTGKNATRIFFGYIVYSDKHVMIDSGSYPYKNLNKVLNVIYSDKGSNSIVVDSYPEWVKGCIVSLDAKEDMSDIPSVSYLDGSIEEIKELDDGKAEIIMNKPLNKALGKGDKIRINHPFGASLYAKIKELKPGEEEIFSHVIQKDDQSYQYLPKAFSRGVVYFRPLILSYSIDPEENTIQIRDFTIQY